MQEIDGKKIRRIRRVRGLSTEELSDKSGVSAYTIRDIERGASKGSNFTTIALICDVLGCTIDHITTLTEKREVFSATDGRD